MEQNWIDRQDLPLDCPLKVQFLGRDWYSRGHVYAAQCIFKLEDGRTFDLFAFRRNVKGVGNIYAPRKTDIDFGHGIEENSWWEITLIKNNQGYTTWMTAKKL